MSQADKRSVNTDALATLGYTIDLQREKRDAIHIAVEPIEAGELLHPGMHVRMQDGKAYRSGLAYGPSAVGIVDPFLATPVYQGEAFWLLVYPRTITSLRHEWDHPAFTPKSAITKEIAEQQGIPVVEVPLGEAVKSEDTMGMPAPIHASTTLGLEALSSKVLGGIVLPMTEAQLNKAVAVVRPILDANNVPVSKEDAELYLRNYARNMNIDFDRMIELAKSWEPERAGGHWGGDFDTRGEEWEGASCGDDFWNAYEVYSGVKMPDTSRGNLFNCNCS